MPDPLVWRLQASLRHLRLAQLMTHYYHIWTYNPRFYSLCQASLRHLRLAARYGYHDHHHTRKDKDLQRLRKAHPKEFHGILRVMGMEDRIFSPTYDPSGHVVRHGALRERLGGVLGGRAAP
jgi:hypothetical protein